MEDQLEADNSPFDEQDIPSGQSSPDDPQEDGREVDISPDKDGKVIKRVVQKGKGWDIPSNGDKVEGNLICV
jgi:hypothetical protein